MHASRDKLYAGELWLIQPFAIQLERLKSDGGFLRGLPSASPLPDISGTPLRRGPYGLPSFLTLFLCA
jgi:hypothetical protein